MRYGRRREERSVRERLVTGGGSWRGEGGAGRKKKKKVVGRR